MKTEHPITPPPELIAKWAGSMCGYYEAARWGADQELEACCADIYTLYGKRRADSLRAHRRPKPPSLKEQALAALNVIEDKMLGPTTEEKLIRQALEQLDD